MKKSCSAASATTLNPTSIEWAVPVLEVVQGGCHDKVLILAHVTLVVLVSGPILTVCCMYTKRYVVPGEGVEVLNNPLFCQQCWLYQAGFTLHIIRLDAFGNPDVFLRTCLNSIRPCGTERNGKERNGTYTTSKKTCMGPSRIWASPAKSVRTITTLLARATSHDTTAACWC